MKMKKMILQITAIALLLTGQTYGNGREGGNGGDVLICENGKNYLLDIYQGEKDYFISTIKHLEGEMEDDSIKSMLGIYALRIAQMDMVRAKKFIERAMTLHEEIIKAQNNKSKLVKFTTDELKDIDDSMEVIIPENCEKKQLVVQLSKDNQDVFGLKFRINRKYWSMLDPEQKMYTIAHEVLFEDAIANDNHDDSRRIREYNYLVGSNSFADFTQYEYISKLKTHFMITYQITDLKGFEDFKILPNTSSNLNYYQKNFISFNDEEQKISYEGNINKIVRWKFDVVGKKLIGNFLDLDKVEINNGKVLINTIVPLLDSKSTFVLNTESKLLDLNFNPITDIEFNGKKIKNVKKVTIKSAKIESFEKVK